jgi:hypothetical protein
LFVFFFIFFWGIARADGRYEEMGDECGWRAWYETHKEKKLQKGEKRREEKRRGEERRGEERRGEERRGEERRGEERREAWERNIEKIQNNQWESQQGLCNFNQVSGSLEELRMQHPPASASKVRCQLLRPGTHTHFKHILNVPQVESHFFHPICHGCYNSRDMKSIHPQG